ncbi:MAG TPA: ABC transporter substrate-binding protein [Actinospica sp.]|nr:ABC transporter substrate-binding protein [Actinospica sp.]
MRLGKRVALGAVLLGLLGGCAHAAQMEPSAAAQVGTAPAASLRLGYFANLTHSTALIGVAKGFYGSYLGSAKLGTDIFADGPTEMTALLSGQLDAAYVGPSSALSAYTASHGSGLEIVAGAESGGAELVVAPGITSAADLRGKTLADPQLGNTQDIALRSWLLKQGFATSLQGTGAVNVEPSSNATTLSLLRTGRIAGAWVPEPWASRLVLDGGGHVLVDERSLWPQGRFATTVLVVRSDYLAAHPQTVRELIDGQLAANAWITGHPAQAELLAESEVARLSGVRLEPAVLARAWSEQSVTNDPIAASLRTDLRNAVAVGLAKGSTRISGIYDLSALDDALAAARQPTVSADGLGVLS